MVPGLTAFRRDRAFPNPGLQLSGITRIRRFWTRQQSNDFVKT